MINEQEYKEIKLIGETVGYLLENNLDNLQDNYEVKQAIISASVSYSMSQDIFRLRSDLNKIILSDDVKEKIIGIIQNISALSGEKKEIYSNNILIPNDKEFIEHYNLLKNLKQLSDLYKVPPTVIAGKVTEINKYALQQQNLGQK